MKLTISLSPSLYGTKKPMSPCCPLTISPPLSDLFIASLSLLLILSSNKPHHHLKIPPVHFPFPFIHTARRLLLSKSPNPDIIMSKTPSQSQFLRFSSPQSLSDWLAPRLPPDAFSAWGTKPGTKNVHNLWLELSQGETSLADSTPPIRTVHVATIRIRSGRSRRILIESHQELSDGSVRTRLRPLSEKMKPGETVEEAVLRAVREELGSALPDGGGVAIVPGSYERRVEERFSASYPGLPACYVLHSVDAWVEGLPDGEFCTEEEEEYGGCREAVSVAEKAVSVRRHFWKWIDEEAAHPS